MDIERSGSLPIGRLLRISRPRFWLYEVGTYAVGVAAALSVLGTPAGTTFLLLVTFFVYFLFPGNLFIYGINDIYDYETDRVNPKKVAYETLVMPDEHAGLWKTILLTTLPFCVLIYFTTAATALAFIAFLFFAWQYSAPTIRAKGHPGFDSIFSAGHYVATGVFGYLLAGGVEVAPLVVIAGMAWAIAMHAYSAVPDIAADTEGGIATIATKLGRTPIIILCAALYAVAGILGSIYIGIPALVLGLIYLALMILSLRTKQDKALFAIYAWFPVVNALAGMAVFFSAVFVS